MKTLLPTLSLLAVSASQTAFAQSQIPPGPTPSPDGALVGAWTQFVPGSAGTAVKAPTVELRFVVQVTPPATRIVPKTNADYCADFAIAYTKSDDTWGIDTGLTARTNYDQKSFPIAVCSKALPGDWKALKLIKPGGTVGDAAEYIQFEGTNTVRAELPGPNKIGRQHKNGTTPVLKSVTLGDTGCRGKNDGQDCQYDWPLQTIAKSALAQSPDLVVHVGDYRYFYEGTSPDTWSYWLQDFVAPTRDLLLAAPWALSRGNHEQCNSYWYGKGFSYLFGPSDASCNYKADQTWSFDVAPGGFDASGNATNSHRYVMIDTSDDNSSQLSDRFEAALKSSNQESTWWVSHIPPVNMLYYHHSVHPGTRGVYDSLAKAIDETKIPLCDTTRTGEPHCRPSTVLLGHNHMFQTVKFKDAASKFTWPQMYIVGHGGVALRGAGVPDSCDYVFSLPDGSVKNAEVTTRRAFGFVTWERSSATKANPSGWSETRMDINGNPWSNVLVSNKKCHSQSLKVADADAVNVKKTPWWKFWDR